MYVYMYFYIRDACITYLAEQKRLIRFQNFTTGKHRQRDHCHYYSIRTMESCPKFPAVCSPSFSFSLPLYLAHWRTL